MNVVSRAEARSAGLARYFTGKPCKHGHTAERHVRQGTCLACDAVRSTKRRKLFPGRNLKYDKKWQAANRALKTEYARKWRAANPEKVASSVKKWRAANPEWRRNMPASYWRVQRARRRLVERRQMPAWANRETIRKIYANCPEGFHVDHEIPLRGLYVSGLHVESNLQYLPAGENRRKSNSFTPMEIQFNV